MGFCRRCGEITTSTRCSKCGGTSKDGSTKALFSSGSDTYTQSDKWGQRYLAKSPSSSPTASSPVMKATTALSPSTPSRPASPSKLASFIGAATEPELSSVFGSVLSPKDNWNCVACERKFAQEEVIYPHPDAIKPGRDDLKEVYFCRKCFAERFSKGTCKKCKLAVLSDAPFIKHDQNLWHDNCYVCNYCPNTLGTEIIIDFGGRPSCESCFDSGAYLKQGIPPSPHLSQAGFTFDSPALPPPRSKWGAQAASASNESPWTATKAASKDSAPAPGPQPRPPAWRIQQQRDSSPMARSFDELGEKLQRVGFETSHSRSPAALSVTTTTSQATRQPVDTSLVGSAARSEDLEKHQRLPLLTLDKDFCPVCRQSLGNEGSFIQLPATSSYGAEVVLHEECFTCGKCSLKLGQGKHVEAEGKHWHKDCAPPVLRFRSIVTSLQEQVPDAIDTSQPSQADSVETACASCQRPLNQEQCVTLPRSGKTYHRSCFRCGGCSLQLAAVGTFRSFVDVAGVAYHTTCASKSPVPALSSSPASIANPLRLSSSRTLLPTVPSSTKNRLTQKVAVTSPLTARPPLTPSPSSSIFATRARPLPSLGGLLICAGCSVRATERETVPGPKGTRFHARCLRCGSCARTLDSECRVVVDDGEQTTGTRGTGFKLRCEACRKAEARKSYNHKTAPSSAQTASRPVSTPGPGIAAASLRPSAGGARW